MGKKKKGGGAEKTAVKTDKRLQKQLKKELKETGEEDIDSILARLDDEELKLQSTVETALTAAPSPRTGFTVTAHAEKDEIMIFGGQHFNGTKTSMFNDLLIYHVKKQTWVNLRAPKGPKPRCGHQAVFVNQGGGQLWIFGGDYSSPSQSQFHHFKEVWCFNSTARTWTKVDGPTQSKSWPQSRSGHRMLEVDKHLIVFGGYHDNGRDFRYFSDVWAFSLEAHTWTEIKPAGTGPSPRSASHLVRLPNSNTIMIYGGYSKVKMKKEVERGIVHADIFLLTCSTLDGSFDPRAKFKWTVVKDSGDKPPKSRCGMSSVALPGNRALFVFGGVQDEEDEETLSGTFFNDARLLQLSDKTFRWNKLRFGGAKAAVSSSGVPMETDQATDDVGMETTFDDGVFKVSIGPSLSADPTAGGDGADDTCSNVFVPRPRMNAGLAIGKDQRLYLYGGFHEVKDREVTLPDFYSIDTRNFETWQTLVPLPKEEDDDWVDESSDDGDNDDDESEDEEGDDDDEDES